MMKNSKSSGKYRYTVPSLETYPFQWLWDSCFHAIIYVKCGYIEDAKQEMVSLVSHQFKNGMIPHMIYWNKQKKSDFPVIKWGKPDTSTITQPPMLPYAVWEIYKSDHDKVFLEKIYPNLKAFLQFLLLDRDPKHINLLGIIDPDESGEDNSPRFDKPLNLPPQQSMQENFGKRLMLVSDNVKCHFKGECMRNFFWVRDVPFNVITIKNLYCLSAIAKELGETTDAEFFSSHAKLIEDAMKKYMLEDNIYWPTWGLKLQKIKTKTWHIFSPLFAHLYSQNEAEKVINTYLFKDGFDTKFSIPTVATDEESYDPNGFWRGPVWFATNWFIYKGLREYNMNAAAEKVSKITSELIEKSGFREHFNPHTGVGSGAQEFTWGGLVMDMIV